MPAAPEIRIGNRTAIISFILGTILFLAFVFSGSAQLLLIGYFYIIIAGIVNLVVLIWLFVQGSNDNSIRKARNRTGFLILANIPIAVVYVFVVMYMLKKDYWQDVAHKKPGKSS